MGEKNSWLTLLVIIAIILSVIAIYLSLNKNDNSNNYVTREEFNQEHLLVASMLSESDYLSFRNNLDDYNLCVRIAVENYANCDQITNDFTCYNNLNLHLADCGPIERP